MSDDTAAPMHAGGSCDQAVAADTSDNTLSASHAGGDSGSEGKRLSGPGLKAIVTKPQQHEQEPQQQQQQEHKQRARHGPFYVVTAPVRAAGRKLNSVISRRRKQLQDLDKDALCLQTVNALLPAKVLDDIREQLRDSSSQFTAVETVAKKRLLQLAGADVGKVFVALAGAVSAGCGVVHATKGLVCLAAKPLRLRRPVGFVINNVIMPTSAYGPLFSAYVVVMTARGALQKLAAETEVHPVKQAAAAPSSPAAAAAAAVHSDAESTTPSHKGEMTAKRIAQYQAAVRTSSSSINDMQLPSASRLASSSSSPAPLQQQLQQANDQQQQQQQHKAEKQGSKSWWTVLKKQRSAPAAAVAAAAPAGAPAEAPAASDDLVQCRDLDHSTAAHSSNSSGPRQLSVPKGPSTPPTPGRAEAAAAAAAAEPMTSPKVLHGSSNDIVQQAPALPAVEPCNVHLRHVTEPPQQQQQQQVEQDATQASSFAAAAAADDTDSFPHTDLLAALRPTQINSSDTAHHSDQLPELILAPVANPGQVSKLQRRWSSHDSDLIDDGFRSGLALAPFRPPVFSRLPSGKGGCRITSAAAAVTENEQQQQLLQSQCSGECCIDAIAAAAAAVGGGDGGVLRTVSLDMTAAAQRAMVVQQQQQQEHTEQEGDAAGGVRLARPDASPEGETHMPVGAQQLQHHTRMYKSMDWGHKLPSQPVQERA